MSDADVAGYRIYYGSSSQNYLQARGAGLNAGKSSTYTVTNLVAGQIYYFAVSAYDASGNESPLSPEVAKQVK